MLTYCFNDIVRGNDLRKVTEDAHPREELRTDHNTCADGEVSVTVWNEHHILSQSVEHRADELLVKTELFDIILDKGFCKIFVRMIQNF